MSLKSATSAESAESNPPRLNEADLSFLEQDFEKMVEDVVELLLGDPYVYEQKVVECLQYAIYQEVLIDDVFMKKVFNEHFRAYVSDILKMFRILNYSNDETVRSENAKDRAEKIMEYLILVVKMAQESLKSSSEEKNEGLGGVPSKVKNDFMLSGFRFGGKEFFTPDDDKY